MNRCFTEKDIQMSYKHVEKCPLSLGIREMQMKTSLLMCVFKSFDWVFCLLLHCESFWRDWVCLLFYSENKSLTRYTFCDSLLSLARPCLYGVFWRSQVFNFARIHFIKSFFMNCAFGVIFEKSWQANVTRFASVFY